LALTQLERALDVDLFDRLGRRLQLNENGRALLPRAVSLIEQATELESLFDVHHASPLRIASSRTIGEYLLPRLISEWKQTHTENSVHLDVAKTREVLEAVAAFDADIGFIEGPASRPGLLVRRWRSDELVVIAAPGNPLAAGRVSARQLARASWIVREHGSGTRESADRWLLTALPEMRVEMELGSNEAVKRAVHSGAGVGCLSRLAVSEALDQGWLVELRTSLPTMRRSLATVVHSTKELGSVARDFLRHCSTETRISR
jgi:DNA-binding transcriptional LysR family regulator